MLLETINSSKDVKKLSLPDFQQRQTADFYPAAIFQKFTEFQKAE